MCQRVYESMHSCDSRHTGSNVGPSRAQKPGGMGFLRQTDPGGTVPRSVCQPRAELLNSSCVLRLPSQRKMLPAPNNQTRQLATLRAVRQLRWVNTAPVAYHV
jgi:hypothetical protein